MTKWNPAELKTLGSDISVAANDDRVLDEGTRARALPLVASPGWDPYEVWRTRVRTPPESAAKKPA
jgi:hypothetical protein